LSRQFRAQIKDNRPLNRNHNLLSLINLDSMTDPLPGQFYMLEVSGGYDPILKRAFSLFRRTSDGIQILYRIVGKGTAMLRNMKEGVIVDVVGPLGNAYPLPSEDQIPLVIAGGIGIASVFPVVEKLSGRTYVFYGVRTKDEILMVEEIQKISRELSISTDDGSCDWKGTAVDLLNHFLTHRRSLISRFLIYACGPKPFLKEISVIASLYKIKAYLSLEENMACGIGACLGCVVKTASGYKRVCKEGPVFDSEEIVW
jgi:dihydroorotate dehydrogenase electron transfer subunit